MFAPPLIKAGALAVRFGHAAGRVLFPPLCLGCGFQVSVSGALCSKCWPKVRLIEKPYCAVLGTPFLRGLADGMVSPEAIANPPPFARLRSAAIHTGLARRMVGALKYRDRTDIAVPMAQWMARAGSELFAEADCITAVPLHRSRFFQRRYNQSAELGRNLSRLTGLPFEPDLVMRIRKTRQQVGLGTQAREENVRGAFWIDAKIRPRVEGRRILLVDDVYTTGATVSSVSRALMRKGAARVDVLTFSRVLPGDFEREQDES